MTADENQSSGSADRPGPSRRTVLRGIGTGVAAGSLDPRQFSWAPRAQSWTEARSGPAPVETSIPETTTTIAGQEVTVRKIPIVGTCSDVDRFISKGGISNPSEVDLHREDPLSSEVRNAVNDARENVRDAFDETESDPFGESDSDPFDIEQCGHKERYNEQQQSELEEKGGGDGEPAGRTSDDIDIYDVSVDEMGEFKTNEDQATRYLHPDEYVQDPEGEEAELELREQRIDVIRDHVDMEEIPLRDSEESDFRLELGEIDLGLQADPVITIPEWRPTHPVSEECKRAWCEYVTTIYEHERGHAEDWIEIIDRIRSELQGDPIDYLSGPREDEGYTHTGNLPEDPTQLADEAPPGSDRKITLKDEVKFYERMQQYLYEFIQWAKCLQYKKAREYHENNEAVLSSLDCSECKECGEYDHKGLTEFEGWKLLVTHDWHIRYDYGDRPVYTVKRQMYHGRFELQKPDSGGISDGVESTVEGILSFLDGIESAINDVLGVFGVELDLVPEDFSMGNDGVYLGRGTVTALEFFENFDGNEPTDNCSIVRTIEQSTNSPETTAELLIDPETDEFSVSFPDTEIEGFTTVTTCNGGYQRGESESAVWEPDVAISQADGSASEMDAPGSADSTGVYHPIEDCRRVLTREIDQDLYFDGSDDAVGNSTRPFLNASGDGSKVGSERVTVYAHPLPENEDVSSPGRIDCPGVP